MKQMINTVVTDMLTALYQPFMFAVVLAVFFMFLYMYANCPKEAGRGCKAAMVSWLRQFKNSSFLEDCLCLCFIHRLCFSGHSSTEIYGLIHCQTYVVDGECGLTMPMVSVYTLQIVLRIL